MSIEPLEGLEGTTLGGAGEFAVVGRLPNRAQGRAVYEGRHVALGYPAVIKLEPARPRSQVAAEATALARLHHPFIPQLLDHGLLQRKQQLDYVVRSYAPGLALSAMLRSESRLEPLRAVRIARRVASAVQASHSHGIIHGDVKPENVIVDPSDADRVHLIDFGTAVLRHSGRPLSAATQGYAAPEVVGATGPTPAADVYALGVLLRESVVGATGQPEIDGVTMPDVLRRIIEQATSADVDSRYASAEEFGQALAQIPEALLANWYLGPFPPGGRPEQPTLELPEVEARFTGNPNTVLHGPGMTSVDRPTLWVLPDAPAMGQATVQTALAALSEHLEVRLLDEEARFVARLDLQQGRQRAPWILAFEDFHSLLEDGLLTELGGHGETMRLLFSSHANLEMAQSTINSCGMDGHICLPTEADDIVGLVLQLVERCARRRRYHDGLRLALRDANGAIRALDQMV